MIARRARCYVGACLARARCLFHDWLLIASMPVRREFDARSMIGLRVSDALVLTVGCCLARVWCELDAWPMIVRRARADFSMIGR